MAVNTIPRRSLLAALRLRLRRGRKLRSVSIWHGGQLPAEEMMVDMQEIP